MDECAQQIQQHIDKIKGQIAFMRLIKTSKIDLDEAEKRVLELEKVVK